MNIFAATTLFVVIILIYFIMIELFTMMFRVTGLPDEKARFQVLSLLTAAGFTTHESEMLLSTKLRRRLAQVTMLFGYVFSITIVSALVNVFMSVKTIRLDSSLFEMLIPIAILTAGMVLIRVRSVRKRLDRILGKLAGKIMHQEDVNTVLLMDYIGKDSIANVSLKQVPEFLRGKTLAESGLKAHHNILVMLVEREGINAEPATAETRFLPGDRLTVFGRYKEISRVFQAHERFS